MKFIVLEKRLRQLCLDARIERLGVFGSVARGDTNADSDIDLLASFKDPIGLFQLIDLEERMEKILGRPVDLGTEASLHPLIRDDVYRDLTIIYEE